MRELTGGALFAEQLRAAGYEVTELADDHVKFGYTVKVGKYAGLVLEIGCVVPGFPLTPPSGPHMSKLLHPIQGGGVHPLGGIHASGGHSKHFGDGWQYWSRPFQKWTEGPKTALRYLGFIEALWATQ